MQSADQLVLTTAVDFLVRGEACWLCTVVATFGASPRPLGALLVLGSQGQVCGSLSGGCIEDDLLDKLAAGALAAQRPEVVEYGVSAEENERFGLPCGGRMKILLEPLNASHLPALRRMVAALSARRAVWRRVDLSSGAWRLSDSAEGKPLQLSEAALLQQFGPRYQLLLVGANELARCLAELALAMDYRVLVTDPRPERLQQWQVNGAHTLSGMPDDVVREQATDAHSIVITLTHDPRIDDMALMQALTQPLFYVGALGSQRTSDQRRQRLRALAISEAQLAGLRAPVGLPIGSKSAMEIAVAVMAELTSLRARLGQ